MYHSAHQISFSIDYVAKVCINLVKHITSDMIIYNSRTLRPQKNRLKGNLAIVVVENGSDNCISEHSEEDSDW